MLLPIWNLHAHPLFGNSVLRLSCSRKEGRSLASVGLGLEAARGFVGPSWSRRNMASAFWMMQDEARTEMSDRSSLTVE